MISRDITTILQEISVQLPVIALLGPRQSGKTTLSQSFFDKHIYISLEDLDVRARAIEDPREFLEFYKNDYGLILDEIQHVPTLLPYIQTIVDREKKNGYFVLTGSQNFLINQTITQTLAGRIGVLTLLPLSISELRHNDLLQENIEDLIHKGLYPRLYAENINMRIWFSSYILTYVERDVRQVSSIVDLTTFQLFLQLCAGRIGQLLNVSSLANDCGITQRTAQHWLSLLQASYIIFLLQPHYKNFSKRLVKTPKLYFYDTGLACSLLGIESSEQLKTHYARGNLAECLILGEFMKQLYNRARNPHIYFWRDNHGHEIDCVIEQGSKVAPVEIKAGRTVNADYFEGLQFWSHLAESKPEEAYVVYAGLENQKRKYGNVVSWKNADSIIERMVSD